MASNEHGVPGSDATPPAADDRPEYDYVSDDVERPGLVEDLEDRVAGDVRFDTYTRQLYATDASLSYHGHCHQKATKKDYHAVGVLRRAGYATDTVGSTCCGKVGTFGYKAEHPP